MVVHPLFMFKCTCVLQLVLMGIIGTHFIKNIIDIDSFIDTLSDKFTSSNGDTSYGSCLKMSQ